MKSQSKKSIIIIGGGPAAMMLACTLDPSLFDVTIVERGKAIGRKFLVAGKGGFNLTHSEDIESMIDKYDGPQFLIDSIKSFTNNDLREWLESIGIETYVGSSKRVFPIKGIKPIEVLKAIQTRLEKLGVRILNEHSWNGSMILKRSLELDHKAEKVNLTADKLIFAMGGGSWKVTGSDGNWMDHFNGLGIECIPLTPSNCVMKITWAENMKAHYGKPIKNISLRYLDKKIKGEMMITEEGIEGSPAYALSYDIGQKININSSEVIYLDLKPTLAIDKVEKLLSSQKKTTSLLKDELSLSSAAIALIKSITTREEFNNPKKMAIKIKNLPLKVIGLGELDEAISTVGGVSRSAINTHMELVNFPNHYTIGEMINWNGPTGGYLLQGCFSMGCQLAKKLNIDSSK